MTVDGIKNVQSELTARAADFERPMANWPLVAAFQLTVAVFEIALQLARANGGHDKEEELREIVRRFIRYHDGVVRCETKEAIQECMCSVCSDARLLLKEEITNAE